jgi:hypothetical protein
MMIDRHHNHWLHKKGQHHIKVTVLNDEESVQVHMETPQELAQQLITDAQTLEAALSNTSPSAADNVLAAVVSAVNTAGLVTVFGADALSAALTSAGYTVTAPETSSAS